MKHLLVALAVGLLGLAAADKKLQMKDLPQPVQKVETLTKGRGVTYEAQIEKNGKKSDVVVDAHGRTPKK